jgi:hypothetical protein
MAGARLLLHKYPHWMDPKTLLLAISLIICLLLAAPLLQLVT